MIDCYIVVTLTFAGIADKKCPTPSKSAGHLLGKMG